MNGYYDNLFRQARQRGLDDTTAAEHAANAFLDGKPATRGQQKVSATERLTAFFGTDFLSTLPAHAWTRESLVLALARYLGQDRVALPALVTRLASTAPHSLQHAARQAALVLRQDSPRWREVEALATTHAEMFDEFVQVFRIFDAAQRLRTEALEQAREALRGASPLAVLVYASLYAFEHLIPAQLEGHPKVQAADTQAVWDAFDDIVAWKLATCDPSELQLDEPTIGITLAEHLSPFLFPMHAQPARHDLIQAFARLVALQIEWNGFVERSAHAFSYDDSIRFVRQGARLDIVEVDADAKVVWRRGETKLLRLHQYWLYRGMAALESSPELLARLGPHQVEAQLQAMAKTKGTWLRLWEVYGLAEQIHSDAGQAVDLFNALLTTELMTAFYIEDFLRPYQRHLQELGSSWAALGRLALEGLAQSPPQNRFPVTWSSRDAKVARIAPWSATAQHPGGSLPAAHAILDFWTHDWIALAERLRHGTPGLTPRLAERPVLKVGRYLFQLPWLQATQNNATASLNNLRRLGARRAQTQEETHRMEQRLGTQFTARGFQVLVGHTLAGTPPEDDDAGEIDLLCARDNRLLVLELKSSFLRRSVRDAWLHRTTTLRKAGLQLQRKVQAAARALPYDNPLRQALHLAAGDMPDITAWIVDTSIEWDHQHFSGYRKVSLEEVLIALRDDRHLLHDPAHLFGTAPSAPGSLYPQGFDAAAFIDCIEKQAVWNEMP